MSPIAPRDGAKSMYEHHPVAKRLGECLREMSAGLLFNN
jgi:hypothetical protein